MIICLLVIIITILHYRTDHLAVSTHIVFRELYLLPIILAGFWFGLYGGLLSALSATALYLPFVLTRPEGITGHNFANIVQIILFNLFGILFGLMRDRDLKQQQRILEAESLAAMGKAVSCIAHDMKTPLVAIGGFVLQVKRKISDEKLAKKLELALDQTDRLEILVRDMLAFARPLQLEYRQEQINDLLEEITTVAADKAARHKVLIRTDLQNDLPEIPYDKYRMHQAILNLLNNALEASPEGSKVTVASRLTGDGVVIGIADCGCGIPDKLRDDIYTPFVTTKKEGTGLGLPIVKKIIDAHQGSIHVRDNNVRGVTFRITLPREQMVVE